MVGVPYRGGTVEIEYVRLNPEKWTSPLVVFLHEGLGSVSMWRDFPERLCTAGSLRGLVYSRPGYGRSTPPPAHERWSPTFLHEQACELLPALLGCLEVGGETDPPWLLGHSDGASIALIYAAMFTQRVAGLVVLAPHVFVEDVAIASIEAARAAYLAADLRSRLARHHADPESAFWGWHDVWLDPRFRRWTIESLLPNVGCPVLAMQGRDDQYGTLAQIEGIARAVPRSEVVVLEACRHSLHRDQPEQVAHATLEFMARHRRPTEP
jgi:pimeloyl-ACP methyl ester carboxylesterase